jgi:hypothetical protein
MKKDDHPKALFEQLIAVQFKYAGNVLAWISEALPTMYNLTVVGLYETERHAGQVVTLNVLQIAVFTHFAIALKGGTGTKNKRSGGTSTETRQELC